MNESPSEIQCAGDRPDAIRLRMLLLEDDENDAELTLAQLQSAQFDVIADVASTRSDFIAYAQSSEYDIIVSDYRLPSTTGMECFQALKAQGIQVPFILVTGALGDEKAVACLKEGVADYVLKDHLGRLPAAVRRALKEQQLRLESCQAQQRISQLNRMYSVLSQSGQAIVRLKDRSQLFLELCRILVTHGHFDLAWVGLQDDAAGPLTLGASWPFEPECLAHAAAKEDYGGGEKNPVDQAIREARHIVCNDSADPVMKSCTGHGGCRRYGSLGAFPIYLHGCPIGAIALHAGEPGFFDSETVTLLDKLAANISFALESRVADQMRQLAIAELDQFFSLSLQLLWICDFQGQIRRLNPAWGEVLGFSAPDVNGKSWLDFVHPQDRKRAEEALRQLASGSVVTQLELRMVSKSGACKWFTGSATPALRDRSICAAFTDISDRKRLEERLRGENETLEEQNRRVIEANRLKTEFLANMSHELRSPLNGIIGFTELLYDGKLGTLPEKPRTFLNRIHGSALHLLELINGVLDLSKVEAGHLEFQPELISLPDVIHDVAATLEASACERQITLQVQLQPGLQNVITDPGRLKQILFNYISNAVKFTDQGGRVVVRASLDGDSEFRIEVEDTGPGIAREDFPRLFVEFQQLDSTRAKRFQGTGLGLSLTKKLTEAQGGRVGVESVPGKGSTFFAVLPLTPRLDLSLHRPENDACAVQPPGKQGIQ